MNTKKKMNLNVQKRFKPSDVVKNSVVQSQPAEKSLTANHRESSDIARRRVSRRGAEGSAKQRNSKRTDGFLAKATTQNTVPLVGGNSKFTSVRRSSQTKKGGSDAFFVRLKNAFFALWASVRQFFNTLALKLGRKRLSFIAAGLALLVITPIIVSVALPNHQASADADNSGSVNVIAGNKASAGPSASAANEVFENSLSGASLDLQSTENNPITSSSVEQPQNNDEVIIDGENPVSTNTTDNNAIATGAPKASPGVITAAQVEAEIPVTITSAYPGFTHPIVAEMQARLEALGYLGEDAPSQYYGPAMEEAIKLFQRTHSLPITGTTDETTFALLFNTEEAKPYMVSEGIEGDDVYALTERLVELEYLSEVTDVFDANVTAAVKRFQTRNGLTADGKIGSETREKIYSSPKANALSLGDISEEILGYQQRLYALGYLITTPDSKYGELTVAAVHRFQEVHGLSADGHLGKTTKELLMSEEAQPNSIGLGDSGDDVARIQSRLVELGYMSSATGYFGSGTEDALKAFQKRNSLSADGKYGTGTRDAIFSANAKKAPAPAVTTNNDKKSTTDSKGTTTNKSSSGGGVKVTVSGANVESLLAVARSRKGCPYVLGAKGPNRFDCSGFVYWCLNQIGVKQGYMTSAGWRNTKYQRIEGMNNIQAGDIIVFYGHVGIAASGSTMLDASSSKNAIMERTFQSSYWKNKFICAYRIF